MKFIRFRSNSKAFFVKNDLFWIHSLQTLYVMGTGDLIAQTVVEKKDYYTLNFRRTLKFAFLGLVFVGPVLSTWYTYLNRRLPSRSRKLLSVGFITKFAVDQLLFAPLFLPVCMTAINVMNRKSWKNMKDDLKSKYKDVLITNYTIWPALQVANILFFRKYRDFVNQTGAVVWNTYLSYKMQSET